MSARVNELLPEFPGRPDEVYDVVIVTGDAYVDHPSFGAGLIGRHLESLGYKVGIIAQPGWKNADDFRRFGRPRLFFGITAGNVDSMVANYTPDRRRREKDSYSPGGKGGFRPDLATVVYANRAREAYPDSVVVLGGIEASLRRLSHYDYVQQKVRASVLADAKADLLVYGMGERQAAMLASALKAGKSPADLAGMDGIAYLADRAPEGEGVLTLPSAEETAEDKNAFFESQKALFEALAKPRPPVMVQPTAGRYVVVNPPAEPLSTTELDTLYALPFTRTYPERYEAEGGIPALAPVRFSVVSHRGCYGGCSFCALTAHQGKAVTSRSVAGILGEVKKFASRSDFDGTIRDVGGPTANMYGTYCKIAPRGRTGCSRVSCLYPDVCPNLETSGADYLKLLRGIRHVQGVKHAFVASGVRHDLLVEPPQRRLFRELVTYHVGGQMKVAPEHVSTRALGLMGKPAHHTFREFMRLFQIIKREVEKDVHIVPYLMTGHPGTSLEDSIELARFAKSLGHFVEQVQTFTPTPMTASTCMYHTRKNPFTGENVYVPSGTEASNQRALVQYSDPRTKMKLIGFLKSVHRMEVIDELFGRGDPRKRQGARPKNRTPDSVRVKRSGPGPKKPF